MATERCDKCNQTFNSEHELEEHRRSAHPEQQQGQGGNKRTSQDQETGRRGKHENAA